MKRLKIITSFLFIICGILEGFDTVLEETLNFEFDSSYSMFALGIIHFCSALAESFDGYAGLKEIKDS